MHDEPKKKYDKYFQKNSSAVSLGLNITAGFIFFTYIGYLIDEKRGGGQAFTLVGIFTGFLYCGYEVWKIIQQTNS